MIYYSTGKSPYMRSVGKAVEIDDATADILLKDGSIVRTKDGLFEKSCYIDKSGKEYTEEEVLAMDKRTALYKEIMGIKTN